MPEQELPEVCKREGKYPECEACQKATIDMLKVVSRESIYMQISYETDYQGE